jgi:acetylornithine/succinyldiaminopimelate/putrescine aminotransferase
MANVMTPSLEHKRFTDALEREIGHNRRNICPFESFVMLNSGSEGNAFVMRIVDVHTGHNRRGRHVKGLVVKGSFHGRTFQAALLTDTTESAYEDNKSHLLSTVIKDYKMTVEQNDLVGLRAAFDEAEKNNWFIETMYLEGVMGEGNPGSALTPEFYALARELSLKHGSILVVDSVQAGLRTTGNLSIVDYDGFEDLEAPDFEVWAKAINAGQFPCSLIALSPRAAKWYRHGVYGNTMTGNPRACAVATAVLDSITPSFRQSIVEKGRYVVSKYKDLQKDMPGAIDSVTGTGLLYAVKLNEAHLTVVASDGVEMGLRRAGVNVIHGGSNALRFTPNLDVTTEELDMQVAAVRSALLRAEQFVGQLQKVDTFNQSVQLMVNQQAEATAVSILRLNGHLFDTGFINKLLDTAEQGNARVLVQNVQVGRSSEETSVATMQVFGDSTNQVGGLIRRFETLCGDGGVILHVLSDPFDAAVSKL